MVELHNDCLSLTMVLPSKSSLTCLLYCIHSDLIEYTLNSQDLNTPSGYLKRYTTPVDIVLDSGKAKVLVFVDRVFQSFPYLYFVWFNVAEVTSNEASCLDFFPFCLYALSRRAFVLQYAQIKLRKFQILC